MRYTRDFAPGTTTKRNKSMYDIINLVTLELIEGGFETYADAAEYLERNGMDYETYGIEGPADEDDRDSFWDMPPEMISAR